MSEFETCVASARTLILPHMSVDPRYDQWYQDRPAKIVLAHFMVRNPPNEACAKAAAEKSLPRKL